MNEVKVGEPVHAIALHGSTFAFAAKSCVYVNVHDHLQKLKLPNVKSLAFSADGTTLFTAAEDKWIASWSLASTRIRPTAVFHARSASTRLVPHPDGRYLAAAGILS